MAKLAYSKLKLKTEIPIAQIEIPVGDDIQIVEVKTYLPIEEKITLLERVINLAQDDMHFYNTIKLDVLLGTEILYAYTNLSFTDAVKDNPLKLYDEVAGSLLPKVIEKLEINGEYTWLHSHMMELLESIYKYNNSALGLINTLTTDYSALGDEFTNLQEKIANPENLTLLKDVLTKLG